MTFAEIRKAACQLSAKDRERLKRVLLALETTETAAWQEKMHQALGGRFVSETELRARLAAAGKRTRRTSVAKAA